MDVTAPADGPTRAIPLDREARVPFPIAVALTDGEGAPGAAMTTRRPSRPRA